MKKIISFVFAVVSTTFLFVGATQAAEKFDPLNRAGALSATTSRMDPPSLPCMSNEN